MKLFRVICVIRIITSLITLIILIVLATLTRYARSYAHVYACSHSPHHQGNMHVHVRTLIPALSCKLTCTAPPVRASGCTGGTRERRQWRTPAQVGPGLYRLKWGCMRTAVRDWGSIMTGLYEDWGFCMRTGVIVWGLGLYEDGLVWCSMRTGVVVWGLTGIVWVLGLELGLHENLCTTLDLYE